MLLFKLYIYKIIQIKHNVSTNITYRNKLKPYIPNE